MTPPSLRTLVVICDNDGVLYFNGHLSPGRFGRPIAERWRTKWALKVAEARVNHATATNLAPGLNGLAARVAFLSLIATPAKEEKIFL